MRRAGLFAVLVAIALVIVWRLHGRTATHEVAPTAHTTPPPIDPRATLKTSSLGGRVTRASDGSPVAGAFVAIRVATMEATKQPVILRTNPNGEWRTLVATGGYGVAVSALGLLPRRALVDVAEHQAATLAIDLDAGGSALRGTVTDIGGGPIAGATVFVDPSSVTTDVEGHYAIAVADGAHEIEVTDEDYCPAFERFATSGADATVDVQLVPGASVRGDVIARDTRAPIPGATISIFQGSGRVAVETADAEGHFVVRQLRTARMFVGARAPGYASRGEEGFEVGPGETAGPIHLVLDPALSISGLVMWKQRGNQPASGVQVHAFAGGSRSTDAWATTRSDGTFTVDGLVPGLYAIQIFDHDQWRLDGTPVEVRDRDVVDQLYSIERGVTVSGRVEPAQLFKIELTDRGSPGTGDARSDGTFTFRGVLPGRYHAYATSSDNHVGDQWVDVGDSDVTNVVVKLDTSPRASVSGKVVDEDGVPVPSAMVAVESRLASTDAAGHFTVTGLVPGKRMITASRDVPMFGRDLTYVDAPSDNNVVTIESRHSKINGRVLRADHQPAPDTWVTATRIEAPDKSVSITSTLTAADGTFTIAPLSNGVYSIVARDKRDGARVEVARVVAGATISIELDPLSSLSGHVTADGKPVEQYELRCGFGDLQQNVYSPEGAFHFEHVQPGFYTCKATTRDGTAEASLTVGAAPAQLDLVLHSYGSVTGTLVNAFTGKPVAGLRAYAPSVPETYLARGPAVSDANGQFIVERVVAGNGAIEISSTADRWSDPQTFVRYTVGDGESVDLGEIRVLPARHGRAGTFGMKTQNLEVIELTPGGPAELAGIRKGDDISTIEGVSTGTLSRQLVGALMFDDAVTAGDTYHFELSRGVTVAVTAN